MEKSSNPSFFIRQASIEDAPSLLSIYRPYVENTAITFEEDLPALEDFQHRMASTLERYPYLAALSDGRIAGYAYAGPFHPRKAYDHAVELSIYVAPPFHHRAWGRHSMASWSPSSCPSRYSTSMPALPSQRGKTLSFPKTVPFFTEVLDSNPWAALKSADINSAAGMT